MAGGRLLGSKYDDVAESESVVALSTGDVDSVVDSSRAVSCAWSVVGALVASVRVSAASGDVEDGGVGGVDGCGEEEVDEESELSEVSKRTAVEGTSPRS